MNLKSRIIAVINSLCFDCQCDCSRRLRTFLVNEVVAGQFSLHSNKGKVIVLSFGATWVPMTFKGTAGLQKLVNAHPKASFYWVSTNAAEAGEKNFAVGCRFAGL